METPVTVVALALLAVAAALNVFGAKESGWVNAAFTLIEGGGLVLFTILGANDERFGEALFATPTVGIISGAALVFFSFLGFENIANLAEEAKHPSRDLPRAIFLSVAIATTLYVLVALAAVALATTERLATADAPLADALRAEWPKAAGALGGIALFATANTALVSLLSASRVVFGMARAGELPKSMAALLPRRETPWVAVLVVAAVAAALVPFGKVAVIASLSSFASLLAFTAVNVALIVLRYREPGMKRPFRVPFALGRLPLLPAIGAVATLAVATQLDNIALLSGGIVLAAFTLFAVVRERFVRRSDR